MLQQLEHLPPGFLTTPARALHGVLPGPTLIHLPGELPEPVFVSVLLHGNEDVGLLAVQGLLQTYAGRRLPRALSILVGNVDAARAGVRHLDSQPDFNRIWTRSAPATPYEAMAAQVVEQMRRRRVFVALDLHNNSGKNPFYCCLSADAFGHRRLARMFSELAVLIDGHPSLGAAFSPVCPTVSCECGEIGNAEGVIRAGMLIEKCLRAAPQTFADAHAGGPGDSATLDVLQAFAVLKVADTLSVSSDGADADVRLLPDIESLNFRPLEAPCALAMTAPGLTVEPLQVFRLSGERLDGMVIRNGSEVGLKAGSIVAMLTRDVRAIRQDCLGYLMQRLPQAVA